MSSPFDAEYYERGCGSVPYARCGEWLSFFETAANNIALSLNPRRVLDVGCAMGFLVEAFWDLGVEAWGIDISPYAISCVRPDMRPYCSLSSLTDPLEGRYDLITCIEVLEHIPTEPAQIALANICRATETVLFSSTPSDFQEATHVNVRPLHSWLKLFGEQGFWPDLVFDASFIAPHAMLLRRTEAPWPEAVLTLFSSLLRARISLADRLKELTGLQQVNFELAARGRELQTARDMAQQQVLELSGHLREEAEERCHRMGAWDEAG